MTQAGHRAGVNLMAATAALALAQCDRRPAEPVTAPVAPEPASIAAPAQLSRADLIAAVARAASAYAAGADPSAASGLTGRTFRVRLPFGCAGPAADGAGTGVAAWRWAADRRSLRLSVQPLDWSRSPLVTPPEAAPAWDGVDGFWIDRPWLATETCPAPVERLVAPAAVESGDEPAPSGKAASLPRAPEPSPQTVGLAAIRAADSSRLGRRDGAAYAFTVRGVGEAPPVPSAAGYRLVLSGRVGAFPGGRAVRCTADSPDRRPVCVVAVVLDGVAFEDAAGARLSEWRPG